MPKGPWAAVVYPAADLFVERSLRHGASFVTGAEAVWTQRAADDFHHRFVVNEDLSGASFSQKLAGQLEGASSETVQLAADLVCLCSLPVDDMGYDAKVARLRAVLGLLSPEPDIDPLVLDAFSRGFASYGAGKTSVWKFMRYLAEFARLWIALDEREREQRLSDSWEWKVFLADVPGGVGAQASALLHLVHPDVFEPIVSVDARNAIGKTFARVPGVAEEADTDRKLVLIRAALEPVLGPTFHFWNPAVEPAWKGKSTDAIWSFAEFGLDFLQLDSFEDMEMTYKLEAASRLHVARRAVLDAAPEWLESLKQAFGRGQNLTNWRQHDAFIKWCEAEPDTGRAVLAALWSSDSAESADLGAFLGAVSDTAFDSPGARANVLAYLLGAWDPDDWVNYKATYADRALHLCDRETAETADVVGRIKGFREFIDELRVRVVAIGGPAATRLEAQGMAWCVAGDFVPDGWSQEKKDALAAFRGAQVGPLPPPASDDLRAWHFRGFGFPDGTRAATQWLESGFVSTFWAELGAIESGATIDELFDRVKAAFPDDPPGRWRTTTGNLYRFATAMKVGDLVVTTIGTAVYVGRVTGDPTWESDSHPWVARRRSVEWLNSQSPASLAGLSPELVATLKQPVAVARIGAPDEVAALVGLATKPEPPAVTLASITSDVADRVFFDVEPLQEIVDLLATKRQLVFYGPPGTGKTLVAQRLAEHLTSEGGEWTLAQFHPSYSYEDFMEGFRPQTDGDGSLAYELRPGPLRRLAEAARSDRAHPHVLIVDEINRGNIPKIFGELLFLLEYRDRPIALQYSDELFSLPPNLYVIGTMNTADRSIALVDAALRRRFYFVPFIPTEPPVSLVLRRWLGSQPDPDDLRARLLDELNSRIKKDEVAIGPSYLMTGDGSQASLERIWRYAILPLLEEHFYAAKGVDVGKDLSLEACLATLNGQAPGTGEPAEALERPADEAEEAGV